MKKILASLLLVCVLCFCSCGNVPPVAETTASEATEATEAAEWTPKLWNAAPVLAYPEVHPENVDIELSLEAYTFPSDVEEIEITMTNKKGTVYRYCPMIWLEVDGRPDSYYYEGSFWVPVPYEDISPFNSLNTSLETLPFTFKTACLKEGYKMTAGCRYRFVIYVENEPHYVEFEIKD